MKAHADAATLQRLREEVRTLCRRYPVPGLESYLDSCTAAQCS
jgi:hypothetical protein